MLKVFLIFWGANKVQLTVNNIVAAINNLPKNVAYQYINPKTRGLIKIDEVILPEGPIYIKRYDPNKGGTVNSSKRESISTPMLWRVANALSLDKPMNLDRVLAGSYNTRSVLESLMVHTPQFYYCYPGRIEHKVSADEEVKRGHKHIIWRPNDPHKLGVIKEAETTIVISEIPRADVFYEAVSVPDVAIDPDMDIAMKRRHTQIQIALIKIGQQLGFRTWVANNDRGILYKEQRLGDMDGVIRTLEDVQLVQAIEDARRAAFLIDCIWFKNGKLMPAVIEIEHTTGVITGLSRMKRLQDEIPSFKTRYVIAAPDDDRDKVLKAARQSQCSSLKTQYFPYSAVEELYSLCERRKIRGVNEEFLDSFMESALQLPA